MVIFIIRVRMWLKLDITPNCPPSPSNYSKPDRIELQFPCKGSKLGTASKTDYGHLNQTTRDLPTRHSIYQMLWLLMLSLIRKYLEIFTSSNAHERNRVLWKWPSTCNVLPRGKRKKKKIIYDVTEGR